jgi:conjugal transfer pilus assembly protein TraE
VGKEKVVVVPPIVNRDFWVSSDTVSDSYLEQMAEFFSSLLLNVTPNSFVTRSEHLLQHVEPNAYAKIKAQLVEQQLEIERRAMSTTFHPSSFKVDRSRLVVELKGQLKILMGNASVESQSKTYQIKFAQHHGRLYIQQFSEVPHA